MLKDLTKISFTNFQNAIVLKRYNTLKIILKVYIVKKIEFKRAKCILNFFVYLERILYFVFPFM